MEFSEHLKSYLSNEEIDKLMTSLKDESLHAVLLNPKKMSDEEFLKLYSDVIKHPLVAHAYIYKKELYNLGKSIYHTLGCFYLQEPSAMVPAYLLNAEENDLVLDMCAAPGGKTIQSSFLMKDKGLIISNDLSKPRTFSIVENIERLGIGNVVITNNDLSLIYNKYLNTFDKIILDAPCSGSGMFRKEDKMAEDWSYNKVLKFAETQKELIMYAYSMVKPGGTICYSTCSFSMEEDEDVIEYLLNNTDAEIVKIDNNPLLYINKKKPLGVHLLPSIFPGEGHYICLIKKPGNSVKKENKEVIEKKVYQFNLTNIYRFGDYIFGLNYPYNFKYFNVVRLGVKIGEDIKGDIKYDYHYAHYIDSFDKTYSLQSNELQKYFNGETINVALQKGIYLLTFDGKNVDLAKSDGRILKNHFPKGLRHKI